MPKAYQISQYDQPLNVDGYLDLPDGIRIGIERAHLEEDTGKSTHFGGTGGRIHGSDHSLIDFNRAGVPLVEIVSRPDIRTAEQARQYVTELRGILLAIGASDAKMEEGSMRCDANVSVHQPGTPFGTRCEIKNVNSVRSLGRAIEYEARRQIDLLESRRDRFARRPGTGTRTTVARTRCAPRKTPTTTATSSSPIWCRWHRRRSGSRRCATRMPMLPAARRARLAEATGAPADGEASMVVVERGQDDYVLAVGARGRRRGPRAGPREGGVRRPGHRAHGAGADLATLTTLEVERQARPRRRPRPCWPRSSPTVAATPRRSPRPRASRRWTTARSRRWSIRPSPTNAEAWTKFCAGEGKAMGALVGAVMKLSQGKADGKAVTALLNQRASG